MQSRDSSRESLGRGQGSQHVFCAQLEKERHIGVMSAEADKSRPTTRYGANVGMSRHSVVAISESVDDKRQV